MEIFILVVIIGILAVILKMLTGYSSLQLLGIAIVKIRLKRQAAQLQREVQAQNYARRKEQEIAAGSRRYSSTYVFANLVTMLVFIVMCAWLPQPLGLLLLIWVVAGQIICSYIGRDDRPNTLSLKGNIYWIYCLAWWPLYLRQDSDHDN